MSGQLFSFRIVSVLCVLAALTSACGAASASPVPNSAVPDPSQALASFGNFDQEFVDGLVAQGWPEPDAITLALTTLTGIAADERSAHFTESFPTGDTADITVALAPGGIDGTLLPQVTSAETGAGYVLTVAYHVSDLALAGSHPVAPNALAKVALAGPVAAEQGADVVVTATIKKGSEAALSAYLSWLKGRYGNPAAFDRFGSFVQVLKSAGSLAAALAQSLKYRALEARIDAAEKCAKNPTNPLTIKAYRTDPGLRDRLVEQATDTRHSVTANAAAVFLSMLNEGAAKLFLPTWKWLTPVLGIGDAWAASNFDTDNEERVRELEASVVKCTNGNLHLRITKAFDDRGPDMELWNAGTITADGSFPAAALDTMDVQTWDQPSAGTWTASTSQQEGDFVGDCSTHCDPCVAVYGGSWQIGSVKLTMKERGNGRYVFELWLSSDAPPKVSGCDMKGVVDEPVYWADSLTVTLMGIGSATPSGSADGYTVEVTQ